MLWWLFVLALFYASARWTAAGKTISAVLFCFAVIGLLLVAQTGFISVFLKSLFEIPVLFVQGAVGIIVALLGGK